jgi:hypothetical protein
MFLPAGRYDPMLDGVERVTSRPAMSVRDLCGFTRMSSWSSILWSTRPTLQPIEAEVARYAAWCHGGDKTPGRTMIHGFDSPLADPSAA